MQVYHLKWMKRLIDENYFSSLAEVSKDIEKLCTSLEKERESQDTYEIVLARSKVDW